MKIMKIILLSTLAMVVGCAGTVPKERYNRLLKDCTEVQKDLDDWKSSPAEIKEKAMALKQLNVALDKFAKNFIDIEGPDIEVIPDEAVFIDNYEGALVRVWVKFTDALGKYYMLFTNDGTDDVWSFKRFYRVGIISSDGDR